MYITDQSAVMLPLKAFRGRSRRGQRLFPGTGLTGSDDQPEVLVSADPAALEDAVVEAAEGEVGVVEATEAGGAGLF